VCVCVCVLLQAARYLLKHGRADPNGRDKYGNTPIHRAAEAEGGSLLMQYLVYRHAKVAVLNGRNETPLHVATRYGRDILVQHLLEQGCDVDAVNDVGDTPCHVAAEGGHIKCLDLLIKAKADLNRKNRRNMTPKGIAKDKNTLAVLIASGCG